MNLTFDGTLRRVKALQKVFNDSNCPKERLAYATAMKVELEKLLVTLDKQAIPMYQEAVARSAIQEIAGK